VEKISTPWADLLLPSKGLFHKPKFGIKK